VGFDGVGKRTLQRPEDVIPLHRNRVRGLPGGNRSSGTLRSRADTGIVIERLGSVAYFNIDRQVDENGDVDELYKAFTETGLMPPDNLYHVPRTIFDDPDPNAAADLGGSRGASARVSSHAAASSARNRRYLIVIQLVFGLGFRSSESAGLNR
jgi:hypothetical protein